MAQKQNIYPHPEEYTRIFNLLEAYLEKESPYLDPNFTCSEISRILGTNECYLRAAVQQSTGHTLQEYLLRLRIRYALDELIIPDDPRTIEEIAYASGFTTNRTFRRNFIRLVHQTPWEFREAFRRKNDDTYTNGK